MKKTDDVATMTEASTKARPNGFKAFMAKVGRLFSRFPGTPVEKAAQIMGSSMHGIEAVCQRYELEADAFGEANGHLSMVPYTEMELRWAAKNGFVLTLHVLSPMRLMKNGLLPIAEELVRNSAPVLGEAPRRARWRLVMRAEERGKEIAALRNKPKSLRKRVLPADLSLAVNAAVLDFLVYGRLPSEARLTAAVVLDERGNPRFNVLITKEFRANKPMRPLVLMGKQDSSYPAVVYMKPHNIYR